MFSTDVLQTRENQGFFGKGLNVHRMQDILRIFWQHERDKITKKLIWKLSLIPSHIAPTPISSLTPLCARAITPCTPRSSTPGRVCTLCLTCVPSPSWGRCTIWGCAATVTSPSKPWTQLIVLRWPLLTCIALDDSLSSGQHGRAEHIHTYVTQIGITWHHILLTCLFADITPPTVLPLPTITLH